MGSQGSQGLLRVLAMSGYPVSYLKRRRNRREGRCSKKFDFIDIINTQMYNYVAGVRGIRSLVHVGEGVADLVLLPLEGYRKDGKIIQGLKKGSSSFLKVGAVMEPFLCTKSLFCKTGVGSRNTTYWLAGGCRDSELPRVRQLSDVYWRCPLLDATHFACRC